ncbi:MAG: PH domain-containing protein [Nitritalea sp.]
MKQVFPSKIAWGLLVFPLLLIGIVVSLFLSEGIGWLALLLFLPVAFFLGHLFVNTRYTLENENLHVRCGWLVNTKIEVQAIKEITETRDPQSAPALSLDRLALTYGTWDRILISPKDKQAFIHALQQRNPAIIITPKKAR